MKQAISIKLAITLGYFYVTLILQVFIWLDQLVCCCRRCMSFCFCLLMKCAVYRGFCVRGAASLLRHLFVRGSLDVSINNTMFSCSFVVGVLGSAEKGPKTSLVVVVAGLVVFCLFFKLNYYCYCYYSFQSTLQQW